MTPNGQTITESERSISAVRWVLALVGAALAFGSRTGEVNGNGWLWAVGVAGVVVGAAAALSAVPRLLERIGIRHVLRAILVQVLDVVAALGLVWVVNDVLENSAWALLTIPIVIASLRLNAVGVLGVWVLTSVGYTAMLSADLVSPGRSGLQTRIVLERPGALLAIAAGVALMTRWLQAGWADQSRLTSEAETRFDHVRTIERAGREMRSKMRDEVLAVCLHHVVELGFGAATATGLDSKLIAAGAGSLVPADATFDVPPSGAVELTEWHGPDAVLYSAAMLEPRSGLVISGWSVQPPGTLEGDALADLVAHTTSSIELAELLERARFDADHDPLTGLANRGSFERDLRAATAQSGPVSMLFMDLDHFKRINDTHGHDAGDWALRAVASVLRSTIDDDCLVARQGGDEFVVLLSGADEHAAGDVARRILSAVVDITTDGSVASSPIALGISIGIACAVGPVEPDVLQRAADDALFDAKREGRGTTSLRRLPADEVQPGDAAPGRSAPDAVSMPGIASPSIPLAHPSASESKIEFGLPAAPLSPRRAASNPSETPAFAPPSSESRVDHPDAALLLTGDPE